MTDSAVASPGSHASGPAYDAPAPVQDLEELARAAFQPGGVLSRAAEAFRPRAGQTEMAAAVARTIEEGGALVV